MNLQNSKPDSLPPLGTYVLHLPGVTSFSNEGAIGRVEGPALIPLLGYDRLPAIEIYLNLSPEDVIRVFQNKL